MIALAFGLTVVGYGVGLTGYCWVTGRDVSLSQLWNPFQAKQLTKLPAAGTAAKTSIIPTGASSTGAATAGAAGAAVAGAVNRAPAGSPLMPGPSAALPGQGQGQTPGGG